MLISFTIENLLSFKNETTFDMTATTIKAHSYSLIPTGKYKILPVTAIYGANAAGKSNFMQALNCMLNCISGHRDVAPPFAFSNKNEQLSNSRLDLHFLICIDTEWTECKYSLYIDEFNKYLKEELFAAPKRSLSRIFTREWDYESKKWILYLGSSKLAKSATKEIKYVSNMESKQDRLLITALSIRAKHPLFGKIFAWVNNTVSGSMYRAARASRYISDTDDIYEFMEHEETYNALQAFIHDINPIIQKISRKEEIIQREMRSDIKRYRIIFDYCLDGQAADENLRWVTRYESEGVWTALHLYPDIYSVLNNGGLLLVDELENSLHPLLMAKIINMFTSPETNPGGGQLIFTTHNALLMDKKYFRQDEIAFIEKDSDGCSTIYRLSDFDGVRSDLDFCKNYILGAFGAIPELSEQMGGDTQ